MMNVTAPTDRSFMRLMQYMLQGQLGEGAST